MDPIVKSIPLSQIHPSPHQARKAFDSVNLRGLAESMRQEGLLNPVVVRKVAAGFELISGERRLRAAKLLGWHTLEAKVISTVSDAEAAAKGLIENIQREDLNTIEEAEGYKELNRLDPKYWTQNKIAQNCGKTQGHVSEFLRFLTLPDIVKGYIRRRILTAGHAAELIRIPKAKDQKVLANRIIKGKLSVMLTREAVDRKLGRKPMPEIAISPAPPPSPLIDPLSDVWQSLPASGNGDTVSWNVSYGAIKGPSGEPENLGWTFLLPHTDAIKHADLANWFRRIAEALDPQPEPTKPSTQPSLAMPANPQEIDLIRRERENLRLPQTPEEQAELEALALRGPYLVYQWMYGANSLTARKVYGRSWVELGMRDPINAVRGMINALRTIQQLLKR